MPTDKLSKRAMKAGYLYVLVHPSDTDLYKIGVTILHPEKRLAQHNRDHKKYAGQIVKETGQKWELRTYISVPDPYGAERAFWAATHLPDIPYRGGTEVERMEWQLVQKGLDAAKNVGVRPPAEAEPLPDYVYAYTAEMNRRLEGRDITLVGLVTSRSGKATFRCRNGHEWRTRSIYVGEGQGCPHCGIGERTPEEVRQAAKLGYLCLLIHPDQPGVIKIGLTYGELQNIGDEWEIHRYRDVQDPVLAESLIWEMLGHPLPHDRGPIRMDLSRAEQAFRELIYRMHREVALVEMTKRKTP
jgi:hypothetical protein